MATFKYSAFDSSEKNTSGFINATDLEEAKQILQDRGLTPLKIKSSSQKKSTLKISTNNLSIFTKQMSALLSAGTPIEKCLLLLSKQSSNNKFSQILLNSHCAYHGGSTLAQPRGVSAVTVTVISLEPALGRVTPETPDRFVTKLSPEPATGRLLIGRCGLAVGSLLEY